MNQDIIQVLKMVKDIGIKMKTLYYRWQTHPTIVVTDIKDSNNTQKSIELSDEEFNKIITAKRTIDEFELLKLLEHEFKDPNGEPHFIYS